MSIDICATILEAAGITPPVPLHGKSLFSDERQAAYVTSPPATRWTRPTMPCAASARRTYKLILNLMPERACCQFSHYKEGAYPPLAEMNVLNLQGKLTPEQAAFMAPNKPQIELFDLRK